MKKKAKLLNIYSPDADNLSAFLPEDPENFCILLQMTVGMENSEDIPESGEIFDLEIFTPKWLLDNYEKGEIIIPKNSMIVFTYNYEKIISRIKHLVESCEGSSWHEIAREIGNFSSWEFKDYQES